MGKELGVNNEIIKAANPLMVFGMIQEMMKTQIGSKLQTN